MYLTFIKRESTKEDEDDTIPIPLVTNALDYFNELKWLFTSFNSADETLSQQNWKLPTYTIFFATV